MASFIIRGIDPALLDRVKAQAEREGLSLKGAMLKRLYDYDSRVLTWVSAMEWGFRANEKGWNPERAMQEFRKIVKGETS